MYGCVYIFLSSSHSLIIFPGPPFRPRPRRFARLPHPLPGLLPPPQPPAQRGRRGRGGDRQQEGSRGHGDGGAGTTAVHGSGN